MSFAHDIDKIDKLEQRIEQLEKHLDIRYEKINEARRGDMLELLIFLEQKFSRKEMERLAKRYIKSRSTKEI